MNDKHTDRSPARRLFIFVGPAAVVSERLAFEEIRIVRRRLVDDDESDLALQVDILAIRTGVVVPMVLRRVNAVADVDDGRVELGGLLPGLIL